jgi:hypothetical protein
MMKVLTSDHVQDPTRVEARIRREVAMRKHGHEKMNDERKLTDEQRREKIETKKAEEDKRGIYGAVFKFVHFLISFWKVTEGLPGSRTCLTARNGGRSGRTRSSST